MDSKIFGQFIAGIRKEKNMTQADLARIIGVTDKAVSRWERGVGFPDINTLEPLAKALDISIFELMRSQKSDMENKNLSDDEVVEMMSHAVEMTRENQKQDKASVWLGGIITVVVAFFVKLSGHANTGGALFVGAMASLVAISLYFFIRNKEDKDSRKIYGFFVLAGVGIFIGLFRLMGIDSYALAGGIYCILIAVICLPAKSNTP